MIRTSSPTVLDHSADVTALLSEAEKARVLVLSRREAVRAEGPLAKVIRNLDRHEELCAGRGSYEIFGDAPLDDLGHAPYWIDAGSVCEDLVNLGTDSVDYVFCLDPWAAQLVRDVDAASGARWYVVSDLSVRKPLAHGEYWAQLEEWFERRPFAGIIAREAWEGALRTESDELSPVRPASVHAQRPGAWQWKKISTSADEQTLHFLVKYSGSLPHLRVFLDSLVRQECLKEQLRATILTSEKTEDLQRYLRWHALAHPTLTAESIVTLEVDQSLGAVPGALVVLADDHTILPPRFSRFAFAMAAADACPLLRRIPLSVEATAHVLTGNLDAVGNYESLVGAFIRESKTGSEEAVRLIPSNVWMGGDLGPLANIMTYVRESDDTAHRPIGPGMLHLGDLA